MAGTTTEAISIIDSIMDRAGEYLREELLPLISEPQVITKPDPVLLLTATCRHCAFSAWVPESATDQSGLEFRAWNHQLDNPTHVIGYQIDAVRSAK